MAKHFSSTFFFCKCSDGDGCRASVLSLYFPQRSNFPFGLCTRFWNVQIYPFYFVFVLLNEIFMHHAKILYKHTPKYGTTTHTHTQAGKNSICLLFSHRCCCRSTLFSIHIQKVLPCFFVCLGKIPFNHDIVVCTEVDVICVTFLLSCIGKVQF